jgi:peptidyl-prolyl cis-trans isomerase SurA
MINIQKKYFFFFLLTFSFLLTQNNVYSQNNRRLIDKIVANVGEENILLSEVEEQYALMLDQNPNIPEFARCNIMDNLIGQSILVHQAKLDSLPISDEEIESQLSARIDKILNYMGGDTQAFEEYYGQTVPEVKEQFRESLKAQLLADKMRSSIIGDIKITPKEVKKFYEKIPFDSLPYFNSEVEFREIVSFPVPNAESKNKAKEKLQKIKSRILVDREDFAKLAEKYSDDPGSGAQGGDLGWQKRGSFVAEFEAAAFSLEKGQYSDIIESEFGFHLIQLIERRGSNIHARHILVKPEINYYDLDIVEKRLDSVSQLLKMDSISFSKSVKIYSSKSAQSFNNDGRVLNPATGNTFFEISDLDPDIFFAIDKLKIGQVSPPIKTKERDGSTSFKLVKLISRSDPHRASLQNDYSKIMQAALEQKKNGIITDWIKNKAGKTFIKVDPMYERCPDLIKWYEWRQNQG